MKKKTPSKKNSKNSVRKLRNVKPVYLFVVAFALVGALALVYTRAAARLPKTVVIATFPKAAAQPTAWGKQISDLKYYGGKIYGGYGDWSANTGPIAIEAYNTTTGVIDNEFLFSSNASHWFNEENGKLYVPAIDRKGSDLAIKENGQWRAINNIGSVHLFSALEFQGKIFVAGQSGSVATVWSSADNGASWKVEVTDPISGRFHFLAELNGKLYTQVLSADNALTYDPATNAWTKIPVILKNITMGFKAETFKNRIVSMNWYPVGENPTRSMQTFDGTNIANVFGGSLGYDFAIDGDYLYIVDTSGIIRRTSDFVAWKEVASVAGSGRNSTPARSLEVINGVIYVGTADSKLHRLDLNNLPTSGSGGKR